MNKKNIFFKKNQGKRQKCEVYSRIVGYIRPVQNWNPGKAEEFKDRRTYDKIISKKCACN